MNYEKLKKNGLQALREANQKAQAQAETQAERNVINNMFIKLEHHFLDHLAHLSRKKDEPKRKIKRLNKEEQNGLLLSAMFHNGKINIA
jgi:hypothetical protein